MKRMVIVVLACALLVLSLSPAAAQFKYPGLGLGISGAGTIGLTDAEDNVTKLLARGFFRYPFGSGRLQAELGIGAGAVAGENYRTELIPVDLRLVLSPFAFERVNPYLYAGGGAFHYRIKELPAAPTAGIKKDGWAGFVPAGVGLLIGLADDLGLELTGGYNYTFIEHLNGIATGKKDAFWTVSAGLTAVGESDEADPDNDGLKNGEEKKAGTDKRNADSDGDGLNDGEEVKTTFTSPMKPDTDGDGLTDAEEVRTYKTNPTAADSDGDGLDDAAEVKQHRTDPMKADTDGDGLNDAAEVNQYRSDPLRVDTDGDGLNDGAEVNQYRTDPLKVDTDGGTVSDNVEVTRGTDPLNPGDDVPKREELKVEVGKAIVLEGVTFATGKADISPESAGILEKAYNTLADNPDITVEIRGYTDNVGGRRTNTRLSQRRADAVKAWLVARGIDATRVTAKGFGPDNPVAPNTTPEGRQQNRRIEFFRIK